MTFKFICESRQVSKYFWQYSVWFDDMLAMSSYKDICQCCVYSLLHQRVNLCKTVFDILLSTVTQSLIVKRCCNHMGLINHDETLYVWLAISTTHGVTLRFDLHYREAKRCTLKPVLSSCSKFITCEIISSRLCPRKLKIGFLRSGQTHLFNFMLMLSFSIKQWDKKFPKVILEKKTDNYVWKYSFCKSECHPYE